MSMVKFARTKLSGKCCVWFLSVVVLACGFSQSIEAANCARCGKDLSSDYRLIIEDKVFCPTHFRCDYCNKSIGRSMYWKIDGKYFDSACYLERIAPKCGTCKQPIAGQYLIVDSQHYHDSCYISREASRCGVCGDAIVEAYFSDSWGNRWHQTHGESVSQCEYCGRLICPASRGGEEYRDGRIVCGICSVDRVMTTTQADSLMDSIRTKLEYYGVVIKREKIPIMLVDKQELQRSMARSELRIIGTTYYGEQSALYGLVKSKKIHVKILYGLPRIVAASIIAHELMHVWQFFHGRKNNRPAFCEGSCNYASYLILKDRPEELSDTLISRMNAEPDPSYGEGFRRVVKLVESRGLPGWMEALEKRDEFPDGF